MREARHKEGSSRMVVTHGGHAGTLGVGRRGRSEHSIHTHSTVPTMPRIVVSVREYVRMCVREMSGVENGEANMM
jgi:hypothetical protein